jgi:hypothetical protein
MPEDSSGESGFWRRLFIAVRLATAAVAWSGMAIEIGMMKAIAGVPVASTEWNRTWEDLRTWAFNPPRQTPIQRLNEKFMIPVVPLMYSGFLVSMITDRHPLIASWGGGRMLGCYHVPCGFAPPQGSAARRGTAPPRLDNGRRMDLFIYYRLRLHSLFHRRCDSRDVIIKVSRFFD